MEKKQKIGEELKEEVNVEINEIKKDGIDPPQKESRDLWHSIKAFRQKLSKTKVIPEEYRIPEKIVVIKRYTPDIEKGLTREQVEERIAQEAVNTRWRLLQSRRKRSSSAIFLRILTLFFHYRGMSDPGRIVPGPDVSADYHCQYADRYHTGTAFQKGSGQPEYSERPEEYGDPDGESRVIPAEELVLDDIVLFSAGNQIPADALVEDGEVLVNESLITGEADQIAKKSGDTLLSGSFIVSGQCRARIEKVGKDSYVSQLTLEAKAMNDEEESEMIRSLDRLVKIIGILIIPIALILFSQQYFINETSLRDSVTATVAAIIGMIPEGLYLLASVALAVSVMRLAMQKVLVHNMKCIETLARVDVLCVDKTGTITYTYIY